jgi:iron complex outermembrane receptor protein
LRFPGSILAPSVDTHDRRTKGDEMRKIFLASACAAAQMATAMSAQAQVAAQSAQAPAVKGQASGKLEEIIVTAERRSETLQTTAIAASVLTGEDLAARGVGVVDQLQFIAPSVTVNNFGQGIDFNIRGIGKGEHNSQTTTGVITYRDAVPSFPGYFTEEPYYDIARVEILRGPQGTFAGQNATGGAVFVTSADPIINGGHTGYIQGQLGNYADFGVQGGVNLPINDTLAARVAFNGETRSSFYDISGPWSGGDGALDSGSVRLGMLWKPDDAWSVLFKADYNYIDMGAYPADPVMATNDMFDISANAKMKALDRFGRAVLKVDYRFSNGMTLRSVTGYQKGNTAYMADLDGTSTGITKFRDSVDENLFSQELNLISPDSGPFKWIVGAFYQSNEYKFPPGEFVVELYPLPAYRYVLDGSNPTWNAAGFAQASYELADGLNFSVGARYTDAHTTNHVNVMQYGVPINDSQSASFTGWSGKVAVDWTINEENFLYGFVATGFKPGGLNVPVGFGLPAPFTEETVTSYEVGWKTRMLDGHVHMQLNAYYNNYNDFQVIVGYPDYPIFGQELNVPNTTTMYGFEAQVQAVYGDLSLDAGLGTSNSSLGLFYAVDPRAGVSVVPCDPKTGPETARCINLKGNEQTYAPNYTFNFGVQYDFAVGDGGMLTPRISYAHVSDQWATLFEDKTRGDLVGARNIWNAQLAWKSGSVITTLYGTNVSDQHYVGAVNSGLRFAGAPRQFGVRVAKAF